MGAEAQAGPGDRSTRRSWLIRRTLLAADTAGLLAAFVATELLFQGNQLFDVTGISVKSAIFVIVALAAWIVAANLYGVYDHARVRAPHSTADEVAGVFQLITLGAWLFYVTSWLIGLPQPDRVKLTTFWFLAFLGVITTRSAARALARRHPAFIQNTVIVGAGDVGQLIGRKLLQHPEYRVNFLGFVDADPKEKRGDLEHVELIGPPDEIVEIVRRKEVDRVIVAFSNDRHEQMLQIVRSLRQQNVQIDVVPRLFEGLSANVAISGIEALPLLSLAPIRPTWSSRLLTRCFDVVGASVLLALTAPLLLVIAWLIRRDSPGPIFFRQTRLGMDMQPFTFLKFRTMRDGTDHEPHRDYIRQIADTAATPGANNLYKLDRADSVTRVGRWLRKTSLDEMPQLLNVLRGDMSLVGPRPCIPYELELFAPHHFERFTVPAGLTGLWQVEARAHTTFVEALDLDVAYARGRSLGLDLRLLLRTPSVMFRARETS